MGDVEPGKAAALRLRERHRGPVLAPGDDGFETARRDAQEGSYSNFISEPQGREREAYGTNYGRLAKIKARYDPDNVFRMNQNVCPAPSAPGI